MTEAEWVEQSGATADFSEGDWYTKAVSLVYADNDVLEREFASALIDQHLRPQIEAGECSYMLQDGLEYEVELPSLADDFTECVTHCRLWAPAVGAECVRAELVATTTDLAKLVNLEGPDKPAQAPSFENTMWVECTLDAGFTISQYGVESKQQVTVMADQGVQ